MADPIIDLHSVHKSFRQKDRSVKVLSGVDLVIGRGEFITVQGKSGSGKSTLLNIIAGLLKPSAGTVTFEGRNIYAMNDGARSRFRNENIGFVFQQFFLIRYLTCEENLSLPGLFSRWKGRDLQRRVEEIMEMLDIASLRKSYPPALSGGQQQRIAIGRALLMKPKILLCDEPIANLDPEAGEKVLQTFMNLAERDAITVIVVSHQPGISEAAGRTYRLAGGKLQDDKAS
jgi:ABC-type lipoprotein export system ATPase subunit